MAGTIKGITIEIGGDATKFDNAIKQADSKAKSLTSELKQINTQLKFDPSNTVLLKQKFDVLSEQVENTKNKLKTLEDAQEQVERQFQDGEIDEGQYRAFQREVEKTRSQLQHYETQLDQAEREMNGLETETDQTKQATKELGDQSQRSAGDVGGAWNTTAVDMASVMSIVGQIGNAIKGAIDLGKRLGEGLADLVTGFTEKADEINTNSVKFGIDPSTYQQWSYASKYIDVEVETMGRSLNKVTKAMGKVVDGNEEAIGTFEGLGVSVYDSNGQLRSSEDVFYDLIDAIGKVTNETEQDLIAQELFGRSFQELEPLISAGSDTLKQYGEDAENMNLVMDQDTLDRLQTANDSIDKLRETFAMALLPVAEALAPVIENIANWLAEKLADPKVQELLERIGEALAEVLDYALQILTEMIESGEMEEFIDWLINSLPDLVDLIKNILDGIRDIIDFISNPGKKATETMETTAKGVIDNILKNLGIAGDDVEGFFNDAGTDSDGFFQTVKDSVMGFPQTVADGFGNFASTIGGFFSDAWTNITGWFEDLKNMFLSIPRKIGEWLSGIGSAITGAFKNIRMPKLRFEGGNFNKWPPTFPHIEWYKEGGIFNRPSIIGVGEAGREAVLPIDKLSDILRSVGVGGGIVVNAPVQVVKELNDGEIARVGGKLTDIVGREFARRTGGAL